MPQISRLVRRGPLHAWRIRAAVFCLAHVVCAMAQEPALDAGTIRGTVKDQSGAVVPAAVVTLETEAKEPRTAIADASGQFQFSAATAGTYKITVTAGGFDTWTQSGVTPGTQENPSVVSAVLQVAVAATQVQVLPPRELAAQQLKEEEKQRVIGVFPNFFVTYEQDAAPLTAKQKFQLGWKTFFDPVPILFSGIGAGIQQARDSYPEYGEGVEGFAKRFGANYADRVDGVLIGHVVMHSVFRQDPRYFYKGAGSIGSRAWHAFALAFVARGDNGKWQPAYADVLGGAASYELSTFYRPGTSRPALRLEHTILLGFAGRAASNLLQEFLYSQVTTHFPKAAKSLELDLRAGTAVPLISVGDLSGKPAGSEAPIEFRLASDLRVNGVVVAKAGAAASGRVSYRAEAEGAVNISLERVRLTVGKVEVPLRSTQVRGASGALSYHRLENSGRIVIDLYVDNDATVTPAE